MAHETSASAAIIRSRPQAAPELKQDRGDPDGAAKVVEQLEPTTYCAVSLTEPCNEDDAAALLCVLRGRAFREQGFHDVAHEALEEALRSLHGSLRTAISRYPSEPGTSAFGTELEHMLSGP